MASGSVVFSKWAIALRGTALLVVELGAPAEAAPVLGAAEDVLVERTLAGGVRVFAEGVYFAEFVSAFDPAEDELEDAKEETVPVPDVPDDAFD
jgi:hypothetical protein